MVDILRLMTGAPFDRLRLSALRYAVNDEAEQYVAVMRVFTEGTAGLLSDLSAREVADRLSGHLGIELDVDLVDARLSYLVQSGNLARSPRETEARSIREYLTARARYQLTQRGELVHRQVEELLSATDEVREVSTEMLGGILAGLRTLAAYDETSVAEVDPDVVAAQVATLFAQFERLVTSTRAFYASLSQVLARYDLGREDFQAFKAALLDYLQRFVDQIARTLPQIGDLIEATDPVPLLARANTGTRLVNLDGTRAVRSSGLAEQDWAGLRAWFLGAPGRRSDADEVRTLATRAMRALLVNLRRLSSSTDREVSRYADLVRLARWFDASDTDQAAALWVGRVRSLPLAAPRLPRSDRRRAAAGDQQLVAGSGGRRTGDAAGQRRAQGRRRDRTARGLQRRQGAAAARTRRHGGRTGGSLGGAQEHTLGHRSSMSGSSDAARVHLLELHARALAGAGGPLTSSATATAALPDGSVLELRVRRAPGHCATVSSPAGSLSPARHDPGTPMTALA